MMALEKGKLFGNLKKCTFFKNKVALLGYIVTAHQIKLDESKVKTIWSWLTSKSIHKV